MLLRHWLTIHFRKILTTFMENEKNCQNINCFFFFPFPIIFFLNGLLTNTLKAFVSISLSLSLSLSLYIYIYKTINVKLFWMSGLVEEWYYFVEKCFCLKIHSKQEKPLNSLNKWISGRVVLYCKKCFRWELES